MVINRIRFVAQFRYDADDENRLSDLWKLITHDKEFRAREAGLSHAPPGVRETFEAASTQEKIFFVHAAISDEHFEALDVILKMGRVIHNALRTIFSDGDRMTALLFYPDLFIGSAPYIRILHYMFTDTKEPHYRRLEIHPEVRHNDDVDTI